MTKENALAASISKMIAGSALSGWYKDSFGNKHTVTCISFLDYMAICLYDTEYGYYRSGAIRIGREGDFYTSSAIGQVLAQVLASFAFDYTSMTNESLSIVEWGAGTGRLSAQIAEAGALRSENWKQSYESILVEDHPAHREAARQAFSQLGLDALCVSSEEAWKSEWLRQTALVFANELFDAFPVHRIQSVDGELWELGVAYSEAKGFYEVCMPLTDNRITTWLSRDGIVLRESQQTEIHAGAAEFLEKLGSVMTRGRLVIIDYGHESAEYAAEHRMLGTLLCYSRHQASASPYVRIGEQDITSHVPFTFIRHAAELSGWQVTSYTTQKQFLIEHGVMDLLQNNYSTDPFSAAARSNRAIRQLLLSDQMSETFKVMVLDKKLL